MSSAWRSACHTAPCPSAQVCYGHCGLRCLPFHPEAVGTGWPHGEGRGRYGETTCGSGGAGWQGRMRAAQEAGRCGPLSR